MSKTSTFSDHNCPIPFEQLTLLKAIAVFLVIWFHIPLLGNRYLLFINIAGQFFILTQCFIAFSKLDLGEHNWLSYYSMNSIGKIGRKVVLPWIILGIAEFVLGTGPKTAEDAIWNLGVRGPGSYYLWIFLQVYLLIPVFYRIFRKLSAGQLLWIGGILCLLGSCWIEWILKKYLGDYSFANVCTASPMRNFYRSVCIRYVYLLFLSLAMVKIYYVPQRSKAFLWTLFLLGGVAFGLTVNLAMVTKTDLIPVIRDYGWLAYHWYYYFYPASLMMFVLCFWKRKIPAWILEIGKNSWIFFIVQIFFFTTVPFASLPQFARKYIMIPLYALMAYVCIFAIVWLIGKLSGIFKQRQQKA